MGNTSRSYSRNHMSLERDVVDLYATVTIGASGAVASSQGGGLVSVAKNATAGNYTVTMDKGYNRLLHVNATVVDASVSPVAAVQVLQSPAAAQAAVIASGALVFQCLGYDGLAVNPASGSQLMLHFQYRRTSSSPWD